MKGSMSFKSMDWGGYLCSNYCFYWHYRLYGVGSFEDSTNGYSWVNKESFATPLYLYSSLNEFRYVENHVPVSHLGPVDRGFGYNNYDVGTRREYSPWQLCMVWKKLFRSYRGYECLNNVCFFQNRDTPREFILTLEEGLQLVLLFLYLKLSLLDYPKFKVDIISNQHTGIRLVNWTWS